MRSDLAVKRQIELLESLCGKIDSLAAKTDKLDERTQIVENLLTSIRRQNATIAANTEQQVRRVSGNQEVSK